MAAAVADTYKKRFFPTAVATARELSDTNSPLGLVWTTGSWIVREALDNPVSAKSRADLEDAIGRGDLAWHGLAVTTHSELADADLFRHGLAIAKDLNARFGRRNIAAKMTDVPGHTRAMVGLLAEAGIEFLHLGVNPVWPVPAVPAVFRWRSGAAEVVVAYQAGGYGGDVVVPGCADVLSFLHSGDNLGPPSAQDVRDAYAKLRSTYPQAEILASTLDMFAQALLDSGAVDSLPVVTGEIGDPWIFGAASDPQKMSEFRRLMRARRSVHGPARSRIDDSLLLVCEHTWGLDEKIAVPEPGRWDRTALHALRASEQGQRFEQSWQEQRNYVVSAQQELARLGLDLDVPSWSFDEVVGRGDNWQEVSAETDLVLGGWQLRLARDGALTKAISPLGRHVATGSHRLAEVTYQCFDEADYAEFYRGLVVEPSDEWWAKRDNAKPGIDASGARSTRVNASLVDAWCLEAGPDTPAQLVARLAFDDISTKLFGAPPEIYLHWSVAVDGTALDLALSWPDKPASRLPEALWCRWNPVTKEPERWLMDKLGELVSPLDVVAHGGRRLHGVGDGLTYSGPDGGFYLETVDAPLVAPGGACLLDADPSVADMAVGFDVLLYDNCWGTNFPMWNEGPAYFVFRLSLE